MMIKDLFYDGINSLAYGHENIMNWIINLRDLLFLIFYC